jgi:hypothetical protein
MRSWIILDDALAILGAFADAILPVEWVLSRRRFWIFAFAAVGILVAIVAVQSASGGEGARASVLGLVALACGCASALIAWRGKGGPEVT